MASSVTNFRIHSRIIAKRVSAVGVYGHVHRVIVGCATFVIGVTFARQVTIHERFSTA